MSRDDLYDVIVVGGGPAGLTAGLYLARARYRVLILEKDDFGGQITITNEVVNYPGVGRTTGRALTQTMRRQAQDFGAEFLSAEAIGLDVHGDVKTVHTSRGDLKAFGILLATGASPRKLGFEGEFEYAGRGVAYCATCDGEFFTGKEVLVVGGGFAAAEESVFLTTYASKVTVLVREQDFTCDATVAAAAKNNPKIDVRYQVELQGVTAGQGGLREAAILNRPPARPKRGGLLTVVRSACSCSQDMCPPRIWCAAWWSWTIMVTWSRTAILKPRCQVCTRPVICGPKTCGKWLLPPLMALLPRWSWNGTPSG